MDVLEQRTDTLYSELQELLKNNQQARLEMQMERLAASSATEQPTTSSVVGDERSSHDGPQDQQKSADQDHAEDK